MQAVLDVSNEVAAELAGIGDGVLDALRARLGCSVTLRGNRLMLDGHSEWVNLQKMQVRTSGGNPAFWW